MRDMRSEGLKSVRRAIQTSEDSVRTTALRYGVSPTTVQKWRQRQSVDDLPPGRRPRMAAIDNPGDELMLAWFRYAAILPLDDCLHVISHVHPQLSRSSLHRCFQRYGVSNTHSFSQLKAGDRVRIGRDNQAGHFRLNFFGLSTESGPYSYALAIEQQTKFALGRVMLNCDDRNLRDFVDDFCFSAPFAIQSVELDLPTAYPLRADEVGLLRKAFAAHEIEFRDCPLPDTMISQFLVGNVEFHYGSDLRMVRGAASIHEFFELSSYVRWCVDFYNFNRRAKALGGRTPADLAQAVHQTSCN